MTKITSDIQRLEAIRITSGIYVNDENSRGVNSNSIKEFIDIANKIYQFIENGQNADESTFHPTAAELDNSTNEEGD